MTHPLLTLDRNSAVIVQGITGRMGRRHASLMRGYGTNIVGGTFSDPNTEPPEMGTPDKLLARLEKVDVEFNRVLTDVRNRNAWGDTFVDALCEPPETFTFGGMFAHVVTFNGYQRLVALDALRRLGVKVEGFGCPTEWEATLTTR